MAVDPKGKNSSEFDIEAPILAAGGNTSAARRARVKSQLRDRFGRWIEMGRDNKIKARWQGKTVNVIGKFVGASPDKPGYGMFLVKNDPNGIPDGVYHFKGKAVSSILASLDSDYLKQKGIRLGHDVNNNPIGDVLDDDIEDIEEIQRDEITSLDEELATGALDKKEKASESVARLQAPKHESHNVVARLDEVTKEDTDKGADVVDEALTEDQQWRRQILKFDAIATARGYDDENKTLEGMIDSDAPLDDIYDFIVNSDRYKRNKGLLEEARGKDMYSPEERTADRQMSEASGILFDLARSRGLKGYTPKERRATLPEEQKQGMPTAEQVKELEDAFKLVYEEESLQKRTDALVKNLRDAFDSGDVDATQEALRALEGATPGDNRNRKYYDAIRKSHDLVYNLNKDLGVHAERDKQRAEADSKREESSRKSRLKDDARKQWIKEQGGYEAAIDKLIPEVGSNTRAKLEDSKAFLKRTGYLEEDDRDTIDGAIDLLHKDFIDDYVDNNDSKGAKATLPNDDNPPQPEALPAVFEKIIKTTGKDLTRLADNETDRQARDTVLHMSELIEKVGDTESVSKGELYDRLADRVGEYYANKKIGTHGGEKFVGKADTIQKITERKEGTTIDPFTFSQNRKGIAVAVPNTNEEILDTVFFDEKLGDIALADYIGKNLDKFDGTFKLGTWHDKDNNEVTLDVTEVFPEANRDEAIAAGQERNQQGIFKLSNKEYIDTGGTGDRGRARRQREDARGEGRNRPSSGQGRVESPDSSGAGSQSEFPSPTDGGDADKSQARLGDLPSADEISQLEDAFSPVYEEKENQDRIDGYLKELREAFDAGDIEGVKNALMNLEKGTPGDNRGRKYADRIREAHSLVYGLNEKLGHHEQGKAESAERDKRYEDSVRQSELEKEARRQWLRDKLQEEGMSLPELMQKMIDEGVPNKAALEDSLAFHKRAGYFDENDSDVIDSALASFYPGEIDAYVKSYVDANNVEPSEPSSGVKQKRPLIEPRARVPLENLPNITGDHATDIVAMLDVHVPAMLQKVQDPDIAGKYKQEFEDARQSILDGNEQDGYNSIADSSLRLLSHLFSQPGSDADYDDRNVGRSAEHVRDMYWLAKSASNKAYPTEVAEKIEELIPELESLPKNFMESPEMTKFENLIQELKDAHNRRPQPKGYPSDEVIDKAKAIGDHLMGMVQDYYQLDHDSDENYPKGIEQWIDLQPLAKSLLEFRKSADNGFMPTEPSRPAAVQSPQIEDSEGMMSEVSGIVEHLRNDPDANSVLGDRLEGRLQEIQNANSADEASSLATKLVVDIITGLAGGGGNSSFDVDPVVTPINKHKKFKSAARPTGMQNTPSSDDPSDFPNPGTDENPNNPSDPDPVDQIVDGTDSVNDDDPVDLVEAMGIKRADEVTLNTRRIDKSMMSEGQKKVLRSMIAQRNKAIKVMKESVERGDAEAYGRNYAYVKATTDAINTLVGGVQRDGKKYVFGSGEEERVKNFTIIEESTVIGSDGKVEFMEAYYTSKSGKTYLAKWNNRKVTIFTLDANGKAGKEAGYVNCYGRENTLGPEHPSSVTPSYLQTNARYRRDGIGGASITFARLAVMTGGEHFSHSASLTPMGANNSKGIDREDPDRHHMSQAEKVLHLMGAPAIELMQRAGWFDDNYTMSEGHTARNFRFFLKPLSTDSHPSYGAGAFNGHLYALDTKLASTARAARLAIQRGETVVSGVDYPSFMEQEVRSEKGNLDSYSLRRLMTEASYKDGISKEEVVKRLKDMRQSLAEYTAGLPPIDTNDYSQRWRDSENSQIDKSLGELANALENFPEFDEKRIDRPKPFPIDSFKTVSSQPYGSIESVSDRKAFDFGTGDNSLNNVGVSIDLDRRQAYEIKFGEQPPEDWDGNPTVIGRRFSRERLQDALEQSLAAGDGDFTGKLDFSREYAEAPQMLPVSSHVLANALYEQGVPLDEVRGIIATSIDKRNGNTELSDQLAEKSVPRVSLVAEMDKMLRALGVKDSEINREANLLKPKKAGSYDAENQMAVSSVSGKTDDEVSATFMGYNATTVNPTRHAPLIDNDKFDYSNGSEDVLGAPPVQPDWRELSRDLPLGTTANAPYIADNFRTEDLVKAFTDALLDERAFVNLKFGGGSVARVPLASVRDALQHQNVDTNGLARSVLAGGNRSERDAQLMPKGRIVPRPANEVVEHGNTVINLDNFEVVQRHLGGVNSPELWRDPTTGKKYIVKPVRQFTGDKADYSQRYVDQEITTQAFYRALGINASMPQRGSYNGSDNYVVAEYIEAKPGLSYADVMEYDPATNDPDGKYLAAIRNGLIGDLFLDQIDGPFNTENVILDENGHLVRIDGGGGLLWDPIPREGPKDKSDRFSRTVGGFVSPTPEQQELFRQANKDGSFDSPGAKFSLDYFLNPKGWHWRISNYPRTRLLEGDNQAEFENQARELLLENMTPDKIDKVARLIRDPRDRGRVVEGLIMRRKAILDHFGIEDTYDANAADLSSRVPYASQIDEANNLIQEMFPHLKTAEIDDYLGMVNGRDATAGGVTDLIKRLKDLKTSKANESDAVSAEELIEKAKSDFDEAKTNSEIPDEISQPNSDPIEIIQPMDKTSNQLLYGDLVINRDGSTVGRVLFRNTTPDGKQYVGMLDDNNNFVEKQYDHNETVTIDTGTRKRRDIPSSEIPAGTLRETTQGVEYVNRLRSRSNQVINTIKQEYPNHVQLPNGDLIVSKRTFTEASRQRRTFEYEVVVHRLPNEKFVSYVRRTQLDNDGNKVGETTVGRISKETHSAVHLSNRIKPLISGGRFKGIHSQSPNNWFANSPDLQNEVLHPGTRLPIPTSLAPANLNQQYIGDTGIEVTGDPIKDALINHVADMISRGHDAATVLRRMNSQTVLSKQQVADIADRVQANRAFPGVNQVPYVSRDGFNLVRPGDRVRHYGADGVVREGWVRGRQPLIVNRRPQGDYGYTDVLRVQFDDGTRSPIVAKNLEIVRRADGSAPEIRDTLNIPTQRGTAYDEPTGLPSGFAVRDEVGDVRTFKKGDDPKQHTQGKIVKVTNREGNTEYVAFAWERGKSTSDLFDWSRRVSDKNVAQAWLIAKMNESESANAIADDVRSAIRSNPSAPQAPQNSNNEELEDFPDSPTSPLSRMDNAEYKVEQVGDDTVVSMSGVEGIDDANLPVSKITRDKKKRVIIKTYANKADADLDKAMVTTKTRSTDTPERLQNKAMEEMKKAVEYEVTGPHLVLGVELPYGDFHALRSSSIGKKYFLDPVTSGGAIISPEREAEYEKILQKFLPDSLQPRGNGKPRIFFTGGGPGAGKSGLSQRKGDTPGSRDDDPEGFIRDLVPTTDEWDVDGTKKKRKFKGEPEGVMINPDDLKLQLPEVQDMHFRLMQASDPNSGVTAERGDKGWAGAAHEESSLLAKILYKRASERQVDIVYDGTGDDTVVKMKQKADTARGAGYEVIGLYLNAAPVDAMARANLRQEDSFRTVPPEVQLGIFGNLAQMLMPTDDNGDPSPNILSGIFDRFVLYDNTTTSRGELPVLLGYSEGGGEFSFNGTNAQVAFNRIRDYVPKPNASLDDPRHKDKILDTLQRDSKKRTRELRAEKIAYQQQQAKQRAKDIKDGKEVEEDMDYKKMSNSQMLTSISGATGLSPAQISRIPGVAAMIRSGADITDIISYVRSKTNG